MEPKLVAQEPIPGSDIPHEKTEEYHIETAEYEFNRIDLNALASHSLAWRTKAIRRLAVVILLQGLSTLINTSGFGRQHVFLI
ncbi:hypothetical protein THARTR1_06257 [Trichoderma harzianum]|uniref:Uncharacterized protein n=1 Tax=Trichoderma harzianum TaxID=5544 RepID=A0A2K0U653_TRIHA|nr:hypothetical protein THARTR1_06257 [Trichoderma harzianum]